jgi:hypothetical protein
MSRKPPRPHVPSLRQVAYHEAGHVVAAVWVKAPIRKRACVSIRPDASSFGHMLGRSNLTAMDYYALSKWGFNAPQMKAMNRLIVSCAGAQAERRFNRASYDRRGAASDEQTQATLALEIAGGDGPSATLLIQVCDRIAKQLIEARWEMVVKVAEALLERETLDEQEVRDLMFGGVPA